MNKKSAKDIAFEREKIKLQRQKRELEERLRDKDKTIQSLTGRVSELENIIGQKDEWIERLLEYTELTKEDLKLAVEKDKSVAEAAKSLKGLMGICGNFYYQADERVIVSSAEVENRGWIYTVMLEPGVYVDVKRTVNGLCYVMDCGDGYMAFDDNGNTFDYNFDTNNVVRFVELNRNSITR